MVQVTTARLKTVLVVEDERAVRQLICLELERLGHTVLQAAAPTEALALVVLARRPIDLVVTDLVLPEGSAGGLIDSLGDLGLAPPVLYVSGYDEPPPALPGRRSAFLSKPFTLERLESVVAGLLGC
jgi:CheY-like chemotaxis protein